MDEPLGALDKRLRETMQVEVRRLQQRLGITTVSVTHDQVEALVMSDVIAVMDGGVLHQLGSPSRCISARPRSSWPTSSASRTCWWEASSGGRSAAC